MSGGRTVTYGETYGPTIEIVCAIIELVSADSGEDNERFARAFAEKAFLEFEIWRQRMDHYKGDSLPRQVVV